MSSRPAIWLLLAGSIALSCGPRPQSKEAPATTQESTNPDSTVFATSLDVTVNRGVRFAFHVTNSTEKKIEVRFGSGQTHDFTVLDSVGRELWRWSADRMFTQAIQTKLVDSRETITYEERWKPEGKTGKFSVVGKLTSINYPAEHRVEFSLP